MSYRLLLCAVLMPLSLHANELVIVNDQTYIVTEDQRELKLKKLVIGDRATIKFAQGVKYWDVSADYADIGKEVVVDGRGANAITSTPDQPTVTRAADCKNGERGADGTAGAKGGDGVDIQMRLAIANLGSMKVMLDGGNGAVGGNGGNGQQGGLAKSCDVTDGGDGGNGGRAGAGGNGGKLVISLSSTTQGQSLMAISHRIEASSDGGLSGKGGEPGSGGAGSEGQFINRKTLTGDKLWVSGGKNGKKGLAGEKAKDGIEGRIFIGGGELNVSPIREAQAVVPTEQPVAPDVARQQKNELEELKQQMRLMQQKLEAMDKQKN